MKRFRREWKSGKVFDPDELSGSYEIKIYPRVLWWWFQDRKVILKGKGVNKAFFGAWEWGPFKIVLTEEGVLLNYEGAPSPFGILRDYLRRTSPGKYLGKIKIKIRGREIKLFWFTMVLTS